MVSFLGACRYGNVRRIPVRSAECREILIIGRTGPERSDSLAVVDRARNLIPLSLPDELAEIDEVLVSPRKNLALVVSIGEGHPLISVYRIADWMKSGGGPDAGIKPAARMDPYPYAWADIAWSGDDEVLFSSQGDYSKFDAATRRPAAAEIAGDPPARLWKWNTAADAVTPSQARR
jgi:hypothetical protein